jgi:hypothetical protein
MTTRQPYSSRRRPIPEGFLFLYLPAVGTGRNADQQSPFLDADLSRLPVHAIALVSDPGLEAETIQILWMDLNTEGASL